MDNEIFETSWLYGICNSKTIKIFQNQHTDFPSISFYIGFCKNEKGCWTSDQGLF